MDFWEYGPSNKKNVDGLCIQKAHFVGRVYGSKTIIINAWFLYIKRIDVLIQFSN